jgi:tetratricopeptide (TPR) repeat protein
MLQQRFDEASETFRQAIPLRPDWHQWYIKLAEAQIGLEQLDAAEQTLVDSLELARPVANTYCLLGYVTERKGDFGRAIEHYATCRELDTASGVPLARLAGVYVQLGDLSAADTAAREALAVDGAIPGAHFIRAQVLGRRGDAEGAAREYLGELEVNPEHVGAHFSLAMHYGERGQTADEARHLEEILRVDPEHPLAALFLANIFLTRGESYERAVALVTAAVEKPMAKEDLAAGYFILSNLHQRLGNASLARRYLQQAESLRTP